jgi:ISXO2-like transposase domain
MRPPKAHEAASYRVIGPEFASHETVNDRADKYVRDAVEGYYSIFKRGMKGVYQHCSEKHLHRHLSEFDFRYSNRIARGVDSVARAERALKGVVGKRLKYN